MKKVWIILFIFLGVLACRAGEVRAETDGAEELIDISAAKVDYIPDMLYYDEPRTPEPDVWMGSEKLTKDLDYSVSYEDNNWPGTAKVIITGQGRYTGTKTTSFVIKGIYAVAFHGNGGEGIYSQNCFTGAEYWLSFGDRFKMPHYELTSWNTERDGSGISYPVNEPVKDLTVPNQVITLYAQWEPAKYKIEVLNELFYEPPWIDLSGIPDSYTVETETFTIPKPKIRGYEFREWYVTWKNQGQSGSSQFYTDTLTVEKGSFGDISLYILADPFHYTIRFAANGGKGELADQEMTYGQSAELPANSFRWTGRTFTGWNTKADGSGTAYTDRQSVKNLESEDGAEITLYAQWRKNRYDICFDANGGTGTMADQHMTYGQSAALTANAFRRIGYSFTGWTTKKDGQGTFYEDQATVKNLKVGDGVSIVLYAKWEAHHYTIRFSANGGKGEITDLEMTYGKAVALPAAVYTRKGYTFDGWNTKADGSGTAYGDRESVKNLKSGEGAAIRLYAQWKANSYTVKFSANGGTGTMAAKKMTYGTAAALPAIAFKRTGYSFTGWTTQKDGQGTLYEDQASVKNLKSGEGDSIVLYAQWEAHHYTIRFSANGGKGTMEAMAMTYGKAAVLSENLFTRKGYTFTGWNTQADGSGDDYLDQESVKNLKSAEGASLRLYAQWRANSYTIKFSANGGTGTMAEKKMTYGIAAALPANTFKRTGYSFTGWNTKADGSGKAYADRESVRNLKSADGASITLRAQWEAHQYTILFSANGGKGTMEAMAMTYGKAASLPAAVYTRKGYSFAGWNTKADGSGTAYGDRQSVKNLKSAEGASIRLYAQWKGISYTIRFNSNGGTGTMSAKQMTYGEAAALPANAFKRTGYTFTGWNTRADGSGTAYENKENVKNLKSAEGASITLYAQWKAHTYTIEFNANGGSGTMAAKQMTYGKSAALPANTFTRKNYRFTGWNTKADGSGTSYSDKASVNNLKSGEGASITLYAQWKKELQKITLTGSSQVKKGLKIRLSYTTEPSGMDVALTYSSSDTSVATVDGSGVVTGTGIGTAVITAKAPNGVTATKTITVTDNSCYYSQQSVSSYPAGVTVAPMKLSYSGSSLVLTVYIVNNSSYTIDSYNNMSVTVYADSGKQIAAKELGDVSLDLGAYSQTTKTFVLTDAAMVDLEDGVSLKTNGTYWYH